MKTRRKFVTTTASSLAAVSFGQARQDQSPVFSFGVMADCQYVDAETRGSRFYRESPRKLEEAVAELNQHQLAFCFHLGDFIDRDFSSYDRLDPIISGLKATIHHALGNHDFEVDDQDKSKVLARLGLKTGYYSFVHEGFRFIVIDTTEVSPYRHPGGSKQQIAAQAELEKLQAEKFPGAKPWNGRPGEKQLAWIEAELKRATEQNETVLVLGHHPILPLEGHAIWNAPGVNQLLQKYSCVKLYLNGHNHAGHYLDSKGLHYLTLDGMLETKDSNAFGIAHLYGDRLEIAGRGRQESHVLKFRA